MDALERQIRRNMLLGLIAELYEKNLSDAISVREWLESKLGELVEDDSLRREDAEVAGGHRLLDGTD